jgi:hypothetical protein
MKRKMCFITSGTQLLLRKTHASTLPDGFRSKDLDQVSASGLLLPDERANRMGCTCLLALPFERFNRRQGLFAAAIQPWPEFAFPRIERGLKPYIHKRASGRSLLCALPGFGGCIEADFGPASKSAIKCRIRSAVTQAK